MSERGRKKGKEGGKERAKSGVFVCYPSHFTLSLWSFLLTMRAVICWSMNRRMVARMANGMAINGAHDGRPLPVGRRWMTH